MNTTNILIPPFFDYLTLPPKVYYMSTLSGCVNCKIKITTDKHLEEFLNMIDKCEELQLVTNTYVTLFQRIDVIDLKTNRTLSAEFISKCTNLSVLKLPKNKFITDDTLSCLTKLEVVDLGCNDNISFVKFSRFEYLRDITLHPSFLLEDDMLLVIDKCVNLRTIDIGVRMPIEQKHNIQCHIVNQTIVRLL